jgi:hypothetical protein
MRRSRPEDISLRDAAITIVNAHGSPNGSATQFDNGLFQITVFTCRQGRGLTVNHRVGGKAVSVFCIHWAPSAQVTTLCIPGPWQAELRRLATEVEKAGTYRRAIA